MIGTKVVHDAAEFKALHEVELAGVGKVFIGEDRKLYRQTNSIMRVLAPCEPVVEEKNTTRVYLKDVNWKAFPPIDQLKYLFETFLSKYDREVMFIIGKKPDGTFLYVVPKQEGTSGSITWWEDGMVDKEAAERFTDQADFVGTVHIHPGNSASPSYTDKSNWEKPAQTGIHMIFGRDGSYTVHGSAAGQVVPLVEGTLDPEVKCFEVPLDTLGRELTDLLTVPPPPKYIGFSGKNRHHRTRKQYRKDALHQDFSWEDWEAEKYRRDAGFKSTEQGMLYLPSTYEFDEVTLVLDEIKALRIREHDLARLAVIRYNGEVYVMSMNQLNEAQGFATQWGATLPIATILGKVGH